MQTIPVIENPRRRRDRTRRTLTPRQLAAGFGGKARMTRRTRKRRNPGLMSIAANPRRRRPSRRRSTVSGYRRRRYSNPSINRIFGGIDLAFAASAAGGIILGKAAPGLIQKVWPTVPVTGFGGMAVRVGSVLAASFAAGKFLRMPKVASGLIAGEIAYELYLLANQYVLPSLGIGLSGGDYLTVSDIDSMALSGYTTTNLRGYEPSISELAA